MIRTHTPCLISWLFKSLSKSPALHGISKENVLFCFGSEGEREDAAPEVAVRAAVIRGRT